MVSILSPSQFAQSTWAQNGKDLAPNSVAAKRALRSHTTPLLHAQQSAISKGEDLPPEVRKTVDAIMRLMEDHLDLPRPGKGGGAKVGASAGEKGGAESTSEAKGGTSGAAGSSAAQAMAEGRRTSSAHLADNLQGKDVVEKSDPSEMAKRMYGQGPGLEKITQQGPQLTQKQLTAVATAPLGSTPVLPAPSRDIGTAQQYKQSATRIENGLAAKVATAAKDGSLQITQNDGTLGFNWTAFFIIIAEDQLKKVGKDLKLENVLRILQSKIAIGSDQEAAQMEAWNREMDRLEAYSSAMRNFPGFERDRTGGLLKKLSNSNPIADESQFDFLNAMKNVQHRGPVSDMQMQQVLSKIATGTDSNIPIPNKHYSDSDKASEVQKLAKPYEGAVKEDYNTTIPPGSRGTGATGGTGATSGTGATGGVNGTDPSTNARNNRKSVADLVSRVMLDMYPGGPPMRRTLLTPAEMSRLETSGVGNDKVVKAAYDSTRVTRVNDWYGSLGQIDLERSILQSASKKAKDHASSLEEEADKIKDDPSRETEVAALRDRADVARDYAKANAEKAESFAPKHADLVKRAEEAKDPTERAALLAEAEKYDPKVMIYHDVIRFAEHELGPNEDRAGDAHRELTNLQDVANNAAKRLKKVEVHIAADGSDSKSSLQAQAEHDLLKRTQIDISLRQIGLGGMFKRYENEAPFHVRLSGWMQDSYELSKARFDLARKDYEEPQPKIGKDGKPEKNKNGTIKYRIKKDEFEAAKREHVLNGTKIPPDLTESRLNYINASAHLGTQSCQGMKRDTGAMLFHHEMITAYASDDPGMKALLETRLNKALRNDLTPPTEAEERDYPKVPSAQQIRDMLSSTSRDRMLKHFDERIEVLGSKSSPNRITRLEHQLDEAKKSHGANHPEVQALQKARDRMQVEQDHIKEMKEMVRKIDPETLEHPHWKKKPITGLFANTKRMVRLGYEGTSKRDVEGATARADADRPNKMLWEYHDERDKDGKLTEMAKMANGHDVDFTDIDERAAFLTGKAKGITETEGNLSVRGNLDGSYRNNSMENLTQMQQNANRIDFSALNTAEGDMQNSAQENSGLANQRNSEISQSLSDSWSKLDGMATQLMKTALSIIR